MKVSSIEKGTFLNGFILHKNELRWWTRETCLPHNGLALAQWLWTLPRLTISSVSLHTVSLHCSTGWTTFPAWLAHMRSTILSGKDYGTSTRWYVFYLPYLIIFSVFPQYIVKERQSKLKERQNKLNERQTKLNERQTKMKTKTD